MNNFDQNNLSFVSIIVPCRLVETLSHFALCACYACLSRRRDKSLFNPSLCSGERGKTCNLDFFGALAIIGYS